MITDREISQLFSATQLAFDQSPVKKYATERALQWYYAISSTRLTMGTTVIVGFNWGAESNESYKPQTSIPEESFKDLRDLKWLGSLERTFQPLMERFPDEDIEHAVQTNFCFFRSKVEHEITQEDLNLSAPLFGQLIAFLKPKRIIGFSKKLESYCVENDLCRKIQTASFQSNRRTLYTSKGFFKVADTEIPIFFLPHPNAKFTSEARKNAWDFCFSG